MQPPKPVVFAMGANHFGQCAPDSNDELIRTPRPLRFGADQDTYATDVNGANWSQVICRVEGVGASGSSAPAHALAGYGASFQEDVTNDAPKTAYGRLPCDLKPRRYIGAEQYVALLDEDGSLWLFESPHDDDDRDAIVEMKLNKVTGRRWTDADMDGQGRVVAINTNGTAFLFPSLLSFQSVCSENASADSVDDFRLVSAVAEAALPPFTSVSAGMAHFLLLARTPELGSTLSAAPHSMQPPTHALWAVGDGRFSQLGPSISHLHLRENDSSAISLRPIPFFSVSEGFPSTLVQVEVGGRHNAVRTAEGDVYVWGWNGEGQLGVGNQDGAGARRSPALVLLMMSSSEKAEGELAQEHDHGEEEGEEVDLPIVDIACGAAHTALVGADGSLWVCGSGEHGQLGLGPSAPPSLFGSPNPQHSSDPSKRQIAQFVRHASFGPARAVSSCLDSEEGPDSRPLARRVRAGKWTTYVVASSSPRPHASDAG